LVFLEKKASLTTSATAKLTFEHFKFVFFSFQLLLNVPFTLTGVREGVEGFGTFSSHSRTVCLTLFQIY